MYPYYGYYDSTIIILLPAIILSAYAQFKVSSTTTKYFKVRSQRGYTGEMAARRVLDANGLHNVKIEMVRGSLSDHYDPRSETVRLSQDVYYGTSITSVSVACHECGHAIQHAVGYEPLKFRTNLVPVVNFASSLSWPLIAIGLFMTGPLLNIGIILFSATVLFQLVTLPVEYNASSRAIVQMNNLGIIENGEVSKCKNVLSAAALTYVAAALSALLQLLRLLAIANRNDD